MTGQVDSILDRLMAAHPDWTCTQVLQAAEPELTAYADAQADRNEARQARRAQVEQDRQAALRAAHPGAQVVALDAIRRRREGRG